MDDSLDKIHEECGVFGILDSGEDAARVTYFALYSLQHRGQENAGIATANGRKIKLFKKRGLVSQVFNEENLSLLDGHLAIGHNRYSTTGSDSDKNSSPMLIKSSTGDFAIAHNGNLVNTVELKSMLAKDTKLVSTTDSEILGHLIAQHEGKTFEEKIANIMKIVKGAYSVTLITKDTLYAFRDPNGFRPLTLGKINGGYAVSSETCAFATVGAKRIRDIDPGEIVKITEEGPEFFGKPSEKKSFCMFEYIYFARPDSVINKRTVYTIRENFGKALAKTCPKDADMVIGVPDSGIPGAIGFAQGSGIPYREGLIKNRYIGRTFINPDQSQRLKSIQLKLNGLRYVLEGKKIVIVDDSIVRGNTMKKIIQLIRDKGALEVHVRITCPPIKFPCFFGVDFPTYEELTSHNHSVDEVRKSINADTLEFISIEDAVTATDLPKGEFCLACFNGEYPILIKNTEENAKFALEKS